MTDVAHTPTSTPTRLERTSGGGSGGGREEGGDGWALLRSRWPLAWSDLGWFVVAFVVLTAVWVGLGELVLGPLDGSVGEVDRDVAERFADGRTPRLDDLSYWGSMLSETWVKIALTAIASVVMIAVWRRWNEALLVAVALILEASVFITVTLIVGRHRPGVPRLDSSPVDSSFPSGHVAAATVYGAAVVIVARHTAKRWPVLVAAFVVTAVTVAVGWARMYRGMHFLSDVVAGVLLGLASLAVTWWLLDRAERRRTSHSGLGDRRSVRRHDGRLDRRSGGWLDGPGHRRGDREERP